MFNTAKVTDEIYWIGASDRTLPRFENIFDIPNGMAYNSYVILDEKIAILDTADETVTDQYIDNMKHILGDREPDFLVIHHMEPDHCVNIGKLCTLYPNMHLVSTAKAAEMVGRFFGELLEQRIRVVGDGDTLPLGKHTLNFITAPMVHWPEVIYSYESSSKILFCADAFGAFGALDGNIFSKNIDFDKYTIGEYRRYYANICGRFGAQVATSLRKASEYDIHMFCPLHGHIVNEEDLGLLLEKYNRWSSYTPEEKGVLIVYGSMYGNTAQSANVLANRLAKEGVENIKIYDSSATELSYLISDAFRLSHIVVASPTYNIGIYKPVKEFLEDLVLLNVKNRKFSIIENGFWSWGAAKKMRSIIEELKNCEIIGDDIRITSSVDEQCLLDIENLAKKIAEDVKNTEI